MILFVCVCVCERERERGRKQCSTKGVCIAMRLLFDPLLWYIAYTLQEHPFAFQRTNIICGNLAEILCRHPCIVIRKDGLSLSKHSLQSFDDC